MARHQLELEGVFATPLEAYRMADQLGADVGCCTLVLSNRTSDGAQTWEVYSYFVEPVLRRRRRAS